MRSALLLCQNGKENEADEILKDLGFKYRLCPKIFRCEELRVTESDESVGCVSIRDNILNSYLLDKLYGIFSSGADYWAYHNYNESNPCEYFSYAFQLNGNGGGLINETAEFLIENLCEDFPAIKDTKYIEWWAHCREHAGSHQLHFDSDDEGRTQVLNPIVSCVLYLNGGTGGPTLVTDQALTSRNLATKGWICPPKKNRMCMFRGDLLHGVTPGQSDNELISSHDRRVTLMIAFWSDLKIRNAPGFGSSRAHPGNESNIPWAKPLNSSIENAADKFNDRLIHVRPNTIEPIWIPIHGTVSSTMPQYDECFQGI